MALRISNTSGTFDLPKDFSTEIEDSSPIYNERGSQSIAATIPVPEIIYVSTITLTELILTAPLLLMNA